MVEQEELGKRIWEMRVSLIRLAMSIVRTPQDAEDAVSAAIVSALQRAETLRNPEKLSAWMLTITARCCYDQLRKAKRETPVEQVEPPPLLSPQETLYDTLLTLPKPLSQVLTLYYYEGMTTGEIARVLDIGRPAVSMRLRRGRKMLKELLEEGDRA